MYLGEQHLCADSGSAAPVCRKTGGIAANSLIYRICLAVWRPIERIAGGGLIGRACRFVGMRGLLLICLAMYLPLDSAVRWVSDAGYLPSFVASVWDECLMLAAFAYILCTWR